MKGYKMTKKRVLIADDFLMSRQVFEKAIEEAEDLELAGSFPSAEEAVDFTRNKYADLVILDIVMTEGINGLSAAKRIKDIRPETKVIMVTSMPEVSYMERAKETGVESFWYKEVQEQPIIDLIRRTLDGESIYPENAPVVNLGNALSTEFTERETQILRELVDGCSNKEIAKKFDISERTVKMHITSMIQKTGFRSRLEPAVKARTGGLVIPD